VKYSAFQEAVFFRFFTTTFLRQLFPDEAKGYLALQLNRWVRAGKLVIVRRGLYVFSGVKQALPSLANLIVEPSYLSGLWALGYYGMIPEAVWEFTSACRISPRKKIWATPLGRFSYRQVKYFGGYERVQLGGEPVLLATREKALLDTWYWAGGEWTPARHREMRYQALEGLNRAGLQILTGKFDSPRLTRALDSFWEAANPDPATNTHHRGLGEHGEKRVKKKLASGQIRAV